jgi:serine/threonine-protein kinase
MGRFVFRKEITQGNHSAVNLYFDRLLDKEVCLKIPLHDGNPLANEEKMLLKVGKHPNIIELYGAYSCDQGRVLILEYLPSLDLLDTLNTNGEETKEESVRAFVRDIAAALDHLHNGAKVIHCDVKPENVIIVNGKAILIDFDCAIDSSMDCPEKYSDSDELLGTVGYRPPEYIEKDIYSEKGDIWAAGITAVVMYSKQTPFTGETDKEIAAETLHGLNQDRLERLLSGMSPDGKEAIRAMLAVDEESRLSSAQLREHKWLRNPTITAEIQKLTGDVSQDPGRRE